MQKQINNGIYILELKVQSSIKFSHQRLGSLVLKKGFYYYVGSAQKHLIKRINRHLLKEKKLHWHIDYLTTNNKVTLGNTFIIPNLSKSYECKINKQLSSEFGFEYPIKNFGSSDCNDCVSHLLFSPSGLNYNQLCSLYHSTVLFMPSSSDIC